MSLFQENLKLFLENDQDKYGAYFKLFEDDLYLVIDDIDMSTISKQIDDGFLQKFKNTNDSEKLVDKTIHNYSYKFYFLLKQYFEHKLIIKHNQNKLINLNESQKETYKRSDREIRKDITIIEDFIRLLSKNCIYNNDIERNYLNKSEDKFVYDYCQKLITDLQSGSFDKSQIYKRTKIEANKNDFKTFFTELKKECNTLKSTDIKQFIDSI